MILGLLFVTHLRFQRAREFKPIIQWPEVEIPKYDWDNLLKQKIETDQEGGINLGEYLSLDTKEQEWLSPDGKIKLTYPAGWIAMDKMISDYAGETEITLEGAETLLFAIRFDVTDQAFALLTVDQIGSEKTLEKIISGIDQNTQKHEGETDITVLNFEDGIAQLEITSKYPNQPVSYSEGLAIFAKEKTYLILFTAYRKDWDQLEKEAESILDSVELLE